jgi:hypothetical protein
MNLLQDIITYIRRIIKTPNNQVITDELIIDYINRFWLMDVDARVQLFDLKTTYQFQTIPGIDNYNMPLYNIQTEPGGNTIAWFPVYQGFMQPARVNGINIPLYTQTSVFYNLWPNYVQQQIQVGTGDGSQGPYTLNLPFFPAIPGHIDITGMIAYANKFGYQDPIFVSNAQINTNLFFIQCVPTTSVISSVYFMATNDNGSNIIVADSGQFLESGTGGNLYGLLMTPGNAPGGLDSASVPIPGGNTPLPFTTEPARYSTTLNTINYNTGQATLYFSQSIPNGTPITAQCYYYQPGIPRSVLFYNNTLTFRPPPNTQYLVDLECYLSPSAFLTSGNAIPFGYMAEYIARGAARKILSDTGDVEQFMFYEPLFKEQETLVWKRSQRQWTATRTDTIFSNNGIQSNYNQSSIGS